MTEIINNNVKTSVTPDEYILDGNVPAPSLEDGGLRDINTMGRAANEKIRVLSLEAGGLRGVGEIIFIKAIEHAAGMPITKLVDYITGTSAGGILAGLYLAEDNNQHLKYDSNSVLDIFNNRVSQGFPQDYGSWIKNFFGIFASEYDRAIADSLINDIMGDIRLADFDIPMSAHTFSLNDYAPKTWSTFAACNNEDENIYARDLIAATSAAPTLLAPYVISGKTYIDGGVMGNGPTMLGIAELFQYHPELGVDDLVVVSLGSVQKAHNNISPEQQGYGLYQWLFGNTSLISIFLEAPTLADEFGASKIFKHYHRLNTTISEELASPDNPSGMKDLQTLAEEYVAQNQDKIDTIVRGLTEGTSTHRLKSICPNSTLHHNNQKNTPDTDKNIFDSSADKTMSAMSYISSITKHAIDLGAQYANSLKSTLGSQFLINKESITSYTMYFKSNEFAREEYHQETHTMLHRNYGDDEGFHGSQTEQFTEL